jgi:hypothetical protein
LGVWGVELDPKLSHHRSQFPLTFYEKQFLSP